MRAFTCNESSPQVNGIDLVDTSSEKRLFVMERVNSACNSILDKFELNGMPVNLPGVF